MLADHIKNIILEKLNFQPTDDQDKLIQGLSEFLMDNDPVKVFLIKGRAI